MNIITSQPTIVSRLGCSLITNQTQMGPKIVSRRKNRFTSSAGINLGANIGNDVLYSGTVGAALGGRKLKDFGLLPALGASQDCTGTRTEDSVSACLWARAQTWASTRNCCIMESAMKERREATTVLWISV